MSIPFFAKECNTEVMTELEREQRKLDESETALQRARKNIIKYEENAI